MVLGGLVMMAPAEEQSVLGPFFERSRPMCGSLAVLGLGELRPPLSGNPIPPSHAAVTIWLPGGPPHSAAVPMNTNGTALDDDWAGEVAGLRAPKTTTIPAAIPIRRERLTRMCAVSFVGEAERWVRFVASETIAVVSFLSASAWTDARSGVPYKTGRSGAAAR